MTMQDSQLQATDASHKHATSPYMPSLGFGLASGVCGLAYGSVASVLIQSPNPKLYTTLSAVQWGATGLTFHFARNAFLAASPSPNAKATRIAASGVAGSLAGVVAAQFLPRGAVITGAVGFGVLGLAAEAGYDRAAAALATVRSSSPSQLLSTWTPMKSLSDEEYGRILSQKLLKVEVEISLLDDQIAELRRASLQQQSLSDTSKGSAT